MHDAMARRGIPPKLLITLLGILTLLMAPHASNLSPTVLGFFYLMLIWRVIGMRHPHALPGRWILLVLIFVAISVVIVGTNLVDGRLAGTGLLVVMLGLKLLELRARRDIHVTVFLGYFLVLTQFLYDQSLPLAVYLFTGVMALSTIQVGLNRVHFENRQQLRSGLVLFGAALPLSIVLFLLFPRLQTPLWGIETHSATTGISDDITLGDIGKLSQSDETAFRVRFDGREPEPHERYWRGPVLWHTDGRHWTAGRIPAERQTPLTSKGMPISYELTLEPTGEYWLFGLDLVTRPAAHSHLNSDLTLVGKQRINRRTSFRLVSDPSVRETAISPALRHRALQLPAEISPRVRDLVATWQSQSDPKRPLEIVQKALSYFSEQPFVYTLTPGTLAGDPVDGFLFETRRGFCEHYAGSFAVLMRLAGIPTRLVLGYQGGEKNPHADHWVVRQSDAHAWNEVWIAGLGWWRVDPTAAVSPDRIEHPIDSALSEDGDRIVFRVEVDGLLSGLVRRAGWLADAVDLGWHRWVIGFTAERQSNLFDLLGLRHDRRTVMAVTLIIGAGITIALVYLISRMPRPHFGDPLPAIWRRLRAKLQKAGFDAPAWQGPDTLCTAAAERFPDQAEQLFAIGRLYSQLRYGRQHSAAQQKALRERVRRLRLRRDHRAPQASKPAQG